MACLVAPLSRRASVREAEDLLHDMRGPLSVIRGQCHAMARTERLPRELVERLEVIDGEVERLVGAIDRLRSALHGVDQNEPTVSVDLLRLVRDAARRYDGTAREREVGLRIEARSQRCEVLGREHELQRLVDNLVSNAVRHAPPGSTVRLALTRPGGHVVLRVADGGAGIDPADRSRIFLRGTRDGGSGGWGLGLAIGRDIATRHAGRLVLDPSHSGASFRVQLPASTSVTRSG